AFGRRPRVRGRRRRPMSCCLRLLCGQSVTPNHFRVPPGTRLGDALLAVVIDVDHPETLRVTPSPVEIIHARPREVTTQCHTGTPELIASWQARRWASRYASRSGSSTLPSTTLSTKAAPFSVM